MATTYHHKRKSLEVAVRNRAKPFSAAPASHCLQSLPSGPHSETDGSLMTDQSGQIWGEQAEKLASQQSDNELVECGGGGGDGSWN